MCHYMERESKELLSLFCVTLAFLMLVVTACSLTNYTGTEENIIIDNVTEDTSSTYGSTGDNVDDFGACNSDLHTYCSGIYDSNWQDWASENGYTTASWKYAVVDCLGAHRDQTSQACNDSLDRRQSLNEAMTTECKSDLLKYCQGVEPRPGAEPEVDCLEENYDQLSSSCAEALDAHEAAKSID